MDRRTFQVLLLPLLAALAIFYPSMRQGSESGVADALESLLDRQLPHDNARNEPGAWPRGPEMARKFLDGPLQGDPQWADGDRRNKTEIDFVIASLPDPIESGLPHQFDRLFSSVQTALQGWKEHNLVLTRSMSPHKKIEPPGIEVLSSF